MVAHALDTLRLQFGFGERGEQHRSQNRDDGDDDEQLDKGEPAGSDLSINGGGGGAAILVMFHANFNPVFFGDGLLSRPEWTGQRGKADKRRKVNTDRSRPNSGGTTSDQSIIPC